MVGIVRHVRALAVAELAAGAARVAGTFAVAAAITFGARADHHARLASGGGQHEDDRG
jgi:hypothetical protein